MIAGDFNLYILSSNNYHNGIVTWKYNFTTNPDNTRKLLRDVVGDLKNLKHILKTGVVVKWSTNFD